MTTYVAQVAPQRSTQYAAIADALAPHELRLSSLGRTLHVVEPVKLGGQNYLKFETPAPLDPDKLRELGMLATFGAVFEYRDGKVDGDSGPWLRPLETGFQPAFPPDLVMTRRYKGKTNELFTQFLCNIARYSSAFATEPWESLRLFDPLSGGGTTLFTALVFGASAVGVEKDSGDVESTAAFVEQYAREQRISCTLEEQRLKKVGRRWWFTLGKEQPRQLILACGNTVRSAELLNGVKKPNLIVTDLPYGIQHHGELTGLLSEALPVWASLLLPGGTITMSWESTRFPRADMIEVVQSASQLTVLNEPPYDQLSHRVDRVIKHRDVVVARKSEEQVMR
jgi:hypothetical protein